MDVRRRNEGYEMKGHRVTIGDRQDRARRWPGARAPAWDGDRIGIEKNARLDEAVESEVAGVRV